MVLSPNIHNINKMLSLHPEISVQVAMTYPGTYLDWLKELIKVSETYDSYL